MGILGTALIVAFFAGLVQWDVYGWGDTMISRPIVVGMLMGLALGDLTTGLVVGATIEFMYLGLLPVGAAVPPDATMATSIAASLAILSGIVPEVAAALAVPVAVASQSMQMLVWTGNAGCYCIEQINKLNMPILKRLIASNIQVHFCFFYKVSFQHFWRS